MAGTTRGREVFVNQVVFDQADYFQSDGYTRVTGLTIADLEIETFFNNQSLNWALVNGATVTDGQVVAGKVYFQEVTAEPGHYSVRWRPNATGFWRILITYPAGQQRLAQDYDVRAEPIRQAGGLKPSFVKPC
jgi:hypothetical protein